MRIITFFFLLCIVEPSIFAQQFKFYFAFEDNSGTKDTAWLVWDEYSTYRIDSLYNEIPVSIQTDTFCVFFKIPLDDGTIAYTKTYSAPSSSRTFTSLIKTPTNGIYWWDSTYISYPLKISWDTTILTSNNLPFQINYAGIYNHSIITNDSISGNYYLDLFHKGYVIIDPPNPHWDYVVSNPLPAIVFFSEYPVDSPLTWGTYMHKSSVINSLSEKKLYINDDSIDLIRISSANNVIMFEKKKPSGNIDLSSLKKGKYIIRIVSGVIVEELIININ